MIHVLDLFSGIGGFTYGLERTKEFKTIAFCEVAPFPKKVLNKHWPNVPIFNHTNDIDYDTEFSKDIDLICGGFPCQAFSSAARGNNVAEDWWPEMIRIVGLFLPRWVIAENVAQAPIEKAKKDLEIFGYNVWTRCISASDAGAPHRRNRWWLCGNSNNESEFHSSLDAETSKLQELCESVWGAENYARALRVSDGLSNRMDRIIALGNSIIPYIPQAIGLGILKYESGLDVNGSISGCQPG